MTKAIRALHPRAPVIMLTTSLDDDAVVESPGAGADAVLARSAAESEAPALVERVRQGDQVARRLFLERPGVAARVVAQVQVHVTPGDACRPEPAWPERV